MTVTWLAVLLLIAAGWKVLITLGMVSVVGKPRKPLSAGDAVFGLVANGLITTVMVIAAVRFLR